ncbi:putative proteinase inhibitor I3, Kunitz legume [Medicago truncatula]|uniref:Kunitz type trypsin inhibitor n=1 Tax=Medicago truncatula TaxID=3880 RepID=G8A259_MEDTR|nr:kunitz type trypsin inhibitor 104-like [Medicago truncatula]KEH38528.1 Kunitz type trypsin inhibitor [Medicago truncatula]RHN74817.1 putative proteinase inhibitor I3, Kunitz legume [Medicago truncatula]
MTTRMIKITSLSLMLWLFMTIPTSAQPENEEVLDLTGRPLESGRKYYIRSDVSDFGGRITLVNKNGSCPLYVGQETTDFGQGLSVILTPLENDDTVVKVNRDFKVKFSSSSSCGQSTEWKLGDRDNRSGRRLIIAGSDGNSFRILKISFGIEGVIGNYNIRFCPSDTVNCGTVGNLRENGKILLALDDRNVLRVGFERA